ncbi:unnamed protein product, partial [Cuscuta europaea]
MASSLPPSSSPRRRPNISPPARASNRSPSLSPELHRRKVSCGPTLICLMTRKRQVRLCATGMPELCRPHPSVLVTWIPCVIVLMEGGIWSYPRQIFISKSITNAILGEKHKPSLSGATEKRAASPSREEKLDRKSKGTVGQISALVALAVTKDAESRPPIFLSSLYGAKKKRMSSPSREEPFAKRVMPGWRSALVSLAAMRDAKPYLPTSDP